MIIEGTDVTMKDCTLTGNTAETKGGGVWLKYGTFKMQGSTTVTPDNGTGKNDVYLWDVNAQKDNKITVTGALSHTPAARITPYSYTDGRVLATGAVEKANFKVTPKNGNEHWRYKKKDGVIKFVTGKLTYTIEEIISVEEHDGTTDAEYYWTMKLDGQNVHSLGSDNSWKPKKEGNPYNINSRQEVLFDYTDYKTVGAYFLIKEEDHSSSDDLIAEVTKDITYQNDQLEFEGQTISLYQEKTFRLEFHNTSEGEVDVVCRIRWEYE